MAISSNGDARRGMRPRGWVGGDGRPGGEGLGAGFSGRRLVLGAGAVILLLWGGLYLAFRGWRSDYRARAAFGARAVAPAIDPLARVVPPEADPAAWRRAVADTHALVRRLTDSGLLGWDALRALRADLTGRVERARPETAALELVRLWAELLARSGPSLAGARIPELLRPALAIEPLAQAAPPGVDPAAWRQAIDATRVMLVRAAGSASLGAAARDRFAAELAEKARRAQPAGARRALVEVWDLAARRAPEVAALSRPAPAASQ